MINNFLLCRMQLWYISRSYNQQKVAALKCYLSTDGTIFRCLHIVIVMLVLIISTLKY